MTDLQLQIARRAAAKVDPEHVGSFFGWSIFEAESMLADIRSTLQAKLNRRHRLRTIFRVAFAFGMSAMILAGAGLAGYLLVHG